MSSQVTAAIQAYIIKSGCLFAQICLIETALWGWWCKWSSKSAIGEDYTGFEMLQKGHASKYATTLDELPGLKTYPIYVEEDTD